MLSQTVTGNPDNDGIVFIEKFDIVAEVLAFSGAARGAVG
jgi:hypothetical protein